MAQVGDLPFLRGKIEPIIQKGIVYVPKLKDFGFTQAEIAKKVNFCCRGGEETGIKRLQEFVSSKLGDYVETCNLLIGSN